METHRLSKKKRLRTNLEILKCPGLRGGNFKGPLERSGGDDFCIYAAFKVYKCSKRSENAVKIAVSIMTQREIAPNKFKYVLRMNDARAEASALLATGV